MTGVFRATLASLLLLLLPGIIVAPSKAAPPVEAARAEALPLTSGARLVVIEEPASPLVAIDVFFRVGLGDEKETWGMNALLTRAWITEAQGRSKELLGWDIGRIGGNVGTYFDGDCAEIWAVSRADEASVREAAATLLLNLVTRPAFTDSAVEAARGSLLRDIAREQEDPMRYALDRLRARVWDQAPYSRAPLGSEKTVRGITPTQAREFYARYYRPDRAVIVVAGNIRPEAAKQIVEDNLNAGGWNEKGPSPAETPVRPETVPAGLRDRSVERRAPATTVMAGFLTPGTASSGSRTDYPALLVLDALLGGGKSARLFRTLRDTDGAAYEARSVLQASRQQGVLTGYVIAGGQQKGADEDAASSRARLRESLLREMRSLAASPDAITDADLSRAKAYLKGRHLRDRQRLKDRAFGAGWAEIMGLGAAFDTEYEKRIDAVTKEQVTRLAGVVLGSNPAVVYTLAE